MRKKVKVAHGRNCEKSRGKAKKGEKISGFCEFFSDSARISRRISATCSSFLIGRDTEKRFNVVGQKRGFCLNQARDDECDDVCA